MMRGLQRLARNAIAVGVVYLLWTMAMGQEYVIDVPSYLLGMAMIFAMNIINGEVK